MNVRTAVLARALPLAALVLASLRTGAQPPPVRILPVGDSITHGTPVPGGYRAPLYHLLTNAGYNVDFTGTTNSNPAASLPDPDHEGHGGWRIDQIDSIMLNVFATTADPDVILVLIGTNDYGQDYDETNAINRLSALIGKMATNRPFAKIIIANLLARTGTNDTHIQNGFNAYLPGVVASHAALGRQVYFDDLRSALGLSDLADSVHPNATGYAKMATNWFAAITNVIGPLGTTNAPALARARGQTNMVAVEVTFSKPVADSAANAALYALDGGVSALAASLSADKRVVTLSTSPQSPNTVYTLSVSGVVDRTAATTPIAAGARVTFLSQTQRGAFANVPEATNYTLLCSLDIPTTPSYQTAQPAYALDQRTNAWPFTRTAYYLELQTATGALQYVWVSLDALTADPLKLGVPTVGSGAIFRQFVTNMNVVCNVPGVSTGTAMATGNIEFWPSNYNATNTYPVPGASSTAYDFGDNPSSGTYGSMQLHDYGAGQTLLAFNRWGGTGGNADLGIGNQPAGNPDWTFAQNAAAYTVKTLQVFVDNGNDTLPPVLAGARGVYGWTSVVLAFSEPLAEDATNVAHYALSGGLSVLGAALDPVTKSFVTLTTTPQTPLTAYTATVNNVTDRSPFANPVAVDSTAVFGAPRPRGAPANVPEAADYTLVYSLEIPVNAAYNTTNPLYTVDNHAVVSNFTRVAYYLELQSSTGELEYVWTAVDPFTTDPIKIGVPTKPTEALFQQPVTNLTIATSLAGITTGTNLSGGNMEFWCWNYSTTNALLVPGASDATFDWGDRCSTNTGGYGSMQIHNAAAGEVVWAFNNFGGADGGNVCLGLGTQPTGNPDWTHNRNAATYTVRTLQVYVLPASNAAPGLAKVEGAAGRTNVTITFTEPVADSAASPACYALSGGLNVLGAALDPVTKTVVTLATDPQTPNATYTLAVTGVTDRTLAAVPVAPGTAASFVAEPDSGVLENIPEAAAWTLVYSLDWPGVANFASTSPAYRVDNHYGVGDFTRVAYYLELQSGAGPRQYVWAEMDPFTADAEKIGVPTVASRALFQQPVTNLTVRSSVGGVVNGTNLAGGNLEFWPWNYAPTNALGVPGASDTQHDWGDRCDTNNGGHACMQVHNSAAGQVVFAVNHWGGGATNVEMGIGNNPGAGHPDWTFQNNALAYATKRLQVFVLPAPDSTPPTLLSATASLDGSQITVTFSEPLADGAASLANFSVNGGVTVLSAALAANLREVVLTVTSLNQDMPYTVTVSGVRDRSAANVIAPGSAVAVQPYSYKPPDQILDHVPEAADYQLVYTLNIPATSPGWNITGTTYAVDNHRGIGVFDRVAYYLELATASGATNWIWVSMDAFTNQARYIGVPDMALGARFQQVVSNMAVLSSVGSIVTGTDIDTGNLEFWGQNYGGANAYSIPGAGGSYDWGDQIGVTFGTPGHGSMQVHNHGAGQVLFAYNNWGSANAVASLGIGTQPSGTPDWTFTNNAASYRLKNLYVLTRPPPDSSAPTIQRVVGSSLQTNLLVTFDEPLALDTVVASNFTLSGGAAVLDAAPGPSLRDVHLATTPLTPGSAYTVAVSHVRDRSANSNIVAAGLSAPFVAPPDLALYARVPEATNYALALHLPIPAACPNYNSNSIVYDLDLRPAITSTFRRVAYGLELATNAAEGVTNWVYVSMNAFVTNLNRIGVPVLGIGAGYQQKVTNLNVYSSAGSIVTGAGITNGNLEFWPENYNGSTTTVVSTGGAGYDWNDTHTNNGQFGSMQVHNYAANGTGQVLFAFNRWGGNLSGNCDVGIGTQPGSLNMDWTHSQSAPNWAVRNLYVLVLPTNLPAATLPPPVAATVVQNPASRTNQLGGSTTLVALASGAAPLAYQWRFGGAPIGGATNAWLELTNLQPADEGDYDFVVANAGGAATSSVASLDVNRPPAVTNLAATATQNVARTISRAALLAQAGDPEGDPVSILSAGPASTNGGTVALGPTDVTYTPVPGFSGNDRFSFVVDDSRGGLSTGAVVLTVISTAGPAMPLVSGPRVTGGSFILSLTGTPGQVYAVQATSHLVTQTWSTVTNITAPTNGLFQYIEPITYRWRQYRTLSP